MICCRRSWPPYMQLPLPSTTRTWGLAMCSPLVLLKAIHLQCCARHSRVRACLASIASKGYPAQRTTSTPDCQRGRSQRLTQCTARTRHGQRLPCGSLVHTFNGPNGPCMCVWCRSKGNFGPKLTPAELEASAGGHPKTVITAGFFDQTLTSSLVSKLRPHRAAYIDVDCDLHSSTASALEWMLTNR